MLSNITIGQYYPGSSPVHKLDPRTKILITVLYIVMLFAAAEVIGLLPGIIFFILSYIISGVPLKMIFRSLKPIIPLIVFTAVLNLFFVGNDVIFEFWIIKITGEGLRFSIFMIVRIIALIAGTSLLTYTTTPIMLTDGLESLLSPLKKLKFPVHELSMMMTIALRFIPTLIEETSKIMSAQKARGADLESGGLLKRAKALIPILIPLFVSAFRRAEELALAMESRCYHGGEGRTRLRELHFKLRDIISLLITALFLASVFVLNSL
ncbi:MAG: energy-coupling factor transporter transmembrane protein EcfT [Oscillospiraceae bacterium]|nr:energy-coupling factor transporter transmembrane protein EcfT [Oscillospiraceae bacterium]